ncbi:MAG: S8 family peptidase [Candidatus Micrarchaeota archaeon]|nr:S8 family peptidase [Candidatus Micrarchaeota archaeon]
MRVGVLFLVVILSVLLVFTFVQAQENSNVKVFENGNSLAQKNVPLADEKGQFARFITEALTDKDIETIKKSDCKIVHKLNGRVSFECPKNAKSPIRNAKKARVFHIIDLEADKQIEADKVWAEGIDGSGVDVVVLDTGVDATHAELQNSIKGCVSFVSGETCDDYNGHGTHVTGIITADGIYTVDSNKATGVAPGAGVYMLKVCGSDGYCYEDDMMAAMEYAVNNLDARIMSISIGGGNYGSHCDSDPLAAKVNWVVDNGYTVVVAAGNDGSGVSSPACASKAIAVGAVDSDGLLADWSNYGSALDIVAPGVSILSTYSCVAAGDCSSNWYAYMSGTSMSTPHVAGTVALLLDADPYASTDDIKTALYSTADPATCKICRWVWNGKCYWPRYVPCTSDKQGAGIVNAYKAYQYITSIAPECTSDADCDDGLFCNGAESCVSGSCQPGVPIDCSSLDDQCNTGVCDESLDACTAQPKADGTPCDDGLFCTVGDSCQDGACMGGAQMNCNDGNDCTTDSCDEENDICEHTNVPDGTLCDDGLFCTIDDICSGGICAGSDRDCSDGVSCTVDECDEENDVCVNNPDDSLCDDGVFCNGEEICNPYEGCEAGVPPSCDDGNECTTDSCSYDFDGCDNIPLPDGTACSEGICCNGACSAPSCAEDTDCDDGDACTVDLCINQDSCDATCAHEPVTSCIDDDGCCPAGCDYTNDNDCEPEEVKCWDAGNEYIMRDKNQLKKFCKCAEGTYGYRSYSRKWVWSAYKYVDTGNNENWETVPASGFYPAYRVRCMDWKWYYTDKDYYE